MDDLLFYAQCLVLDTLTIAHCCWMSQDLLHLEKLMSRKSPLSRKESSNFLAFSFCFEEAFLTFLVLKSSNFLVRVEDQSKKGPAGRSSSTLSSGEVYQCHFNVCWHLSYAWMSTLHKHHHVKDEYLIQFVWFIALKCEVNVCLFYRDYSLVQYPHSV